MTSDKRARKPSGQASKRYVPQTRRSTHTQHTHTLTCAAKDVLARSDNCHNFKAKGTYAMGNHVLFCSFNHKWV